LKQSIKIQDTFFKLVIKISNKKVIVFKNTILYYFIGKNLTIIQFQPLQNYGNVANINNDITFKIHIRMNTMDNSFILKNIFQNN